GFVDAVVRPDGDRVGRHDLGYARPLGFLPGRDGADDDVAIGDDADQTSVVDDRNGAAVLLLHERRGLADGRVGSERRGILGHEIFDLHGHLHGWGGAAGPMPGGLAGFADRDDLRAADGTDALGRGTAVLEGD